MMAQLSLCALVLYSRYILQFPASLSTGNNNAFLKRRSECYTVLSPTNFISSWVPQGYHPGVALWHARARTFPSFDGVRAVRSGPPAISSQIEPCPRPHNNTKIPQGQGGVALPLGPLLSLPPSTPRKRDAPHRLFASVRPDKAVREALRFPMESFR